MRQDSNMREDFSDNALDKKLLDAENVEARALEANVSSLYHTLGQASIATDIENVKHELDSSAKKNRQSAAFADTKVLLELMVLFTSTLLIYSENSDDDCIERNKAAETMLLGSIAAFLANGLISIPCRKALENLQQHLQYNTIMQHQLLLAFESILKVGSFMVGSFAVTKATMLPTATWIEQSTVAISTGAFAVFFPYVEKTVASLLTRCGLLKKIITAEDQIKQLQQMYTIARDALYLSGVAGMGHLLVIGKNACPDIHGLNALTQMVVTGGLSTAAWNVVGLKILVENMTKRTETTVRPAATIMLQILLTLPFSLIPAAIMNDASLEDTAKQQAIIVAALIVAVAVVAAVAYGVRSGLAKYGLTSCNGRSKAQNNSTELTTSTSVSANTLSNQSCP